MVCLASAVVTDIAMGSLMKQVQCCFMSTEIIKTIRETFCFNPFIVQI